MHNFPLRTARVSPALLVALALVACAATGYIAWKRAEYYHWRWDPIVMPEKMARVPAPWSAVTLAERLQASKKVNDARAFTEAAEEAGLTKIVPGGYALPQQAGPRELVAIFSAGPTHLSVTFPEGFTALQMSRRLVKEGFTHGAELQTLAYPPGSISPLEGNLFPDTYLFPVKARGKALADRMSERFREATKTLPRPFPQVNGKPLTQNQLVVLASILEREAAGAEEMPVIAGVLINRLNKGMRLQVDATVQYARVLEAMAGRGEGHKSRLLYSDLKIASPFNTYEYGGLPPAPICNPGLAALRGAARPRPSEYLFYVYSPKLKRHRFATTFAEHRQYAAQARREREALQAQTP